MDIFDDMFSDADRYRRAWNAALPHDVPGVKSVHRIENNGRHLDSWQCIRCDNVNANSEEYCLCRAPKVWSLPLKNAA